MLEKVVTHVPMTPRDSSMPPGYLTIPLYSYFNSVSTGSGYTLSLDTTKVDLPTEKFKASLSEVGINWNSINSNTDLMPRLNERIYKLLLNGSIIAEVVEVLTCAFEEGGCGKSEMQYIEGNLSHSSGNHALIENGSCKICNRRVTNNEVDGLILSIPENLEFKEYHGGLIYPEYAKTELIQQFERLRGNRLLLTRTRVTGLSIGVNERNYNLDPDLLNYMSLISSPPIDTYLSGSKILRQIAIMLIMHQLVLNRRFEGNIIFSPKVRLYSSYKNTEIARLDQIPENMRNAPLRLALMASFLSTAKEVTIDSTTIHGAKKGLENKKRVKAPLPKANTNIWESNYAELIPNVIKKLKQPNAELTQEEFQVLYTLGIKI